MKTMNRLFVILSCLILYIGCGDSETAGNGVSLYYPEYDYVDNGNINYTVFPGGDFNYAVAAFGEANTFFSPRFDDVLVDAPEITSSLDLLAFAKTNADCRLDDNVQCIAVGSNFDELADKSYIAAIISRDLDIVLGEVAFGGEEHKSVCLIYGENIKAWAADHFLGVEELTKGVVVHELGHARAARPHVCLGENVNTAEHQSPSETFTCIMVNNFPTAPCLDQFDMSPLVFNKFCSKCIDKIKAVTW